MEAFFESGGPKLDCDDEGLLDWEFVGELCDAHGASCTACVCRAWVHSVGARSLSVVS